MVGLFIINQQHAEGICMPNQDWSDAPCMDNFPINRTEFQKDWAPYYDYKGSELMESKYVEMKQAISDGTFNEWKSNRENSNVYFYYLSVDKIQNQYDSFVFDDEVGKYAAFPPYFIITVTCIFAVMVIVIVSVLIRRKRK
ncbi:MAG: hypothetical protein ACW9W4_10400 [Candidatus Nitrosopumilus sp. bin_7KS]